MKILKFTSIYLLTFLFTAFFSACDKDEIATTGKVKVSFSSNATDIVVNIRPAENPDITIKELEVNGSRIIEYELNAGNYILDPNSLTYFPNVGFQVRAGETTIIVYNQNNEGNVLSK